MMELYQAAFSAVNIIPTVLLIFVIFYWLLVILGALDISSFDFELDIDVDADIDLDADASEMSVSWLNNVLSFFNIDKIPLMVFLTFFTLPLWAMSVIFNDLIGNESFVLSLLFLVPELILGALIAKPLTIPFVKIFAKLNEPTEQLGDLLGKVGRVVIGASDTKMGQADVVMDGANYRLNIKTKRGMIKRGQSLLVVNFLENEKCYIVEPYETIN